MKKQILNYETLLKVTNAISHSHDPEEVVLMTVNSIQDALGVKGVTLFLLNNKTKHLEAAASMGLSKEYLGKGPVSAVESIPSSLEGPVAIVDVMDDPRIQYPEAAKKEGIASILSVPVAAHGHILGVLRVYTDKRWDFTLNDVNFVQAMACLGGMAIIMARQYKGMKDSLEFLKKQVSLKTVEKGAPGGGSVTAPKRQAVKKKK